MRKLVVGLNLLVLSMLPIQVQANTALDTVKSRINQLLDVLRDPAMQDDSAEELKKKQIWLIFDKTFDYIEFSKRTLSRNWNKLNPDQRKEFTELYKALLDKVYMDRILAYKDQEIVFVKERALAQNRVEVESKIVAGSNKTPIQFRMVSKDGKWWVYDVVVEGISLVRNYRSQFKRIIKRESIEGMFEILRKKVSKLTSRLNQRGPTTHGRFQRQTGQAAKPLHQWVCAHIAQMFQSPTSYQKQSQDHQNHVHSSVIASQLILTKRRLDTAMQTYQTKVAPDQF